MPNIFRNQQTNTSLNSFLAGHFIPTRQGFDLMNKHHKNKLWFAVFLALYNTSILASCDYILNGIAYNTCTGADSLTLSGTGTLTDIYIDGSLGGNATLTIGNNYNVETNPLGNPTAAYVYATGNNTATVNIQSNIILNKSGSRGIIADASDMSANGQAIVRLGENSSGTSVSITNDLGASISQTNLIGVYAWGGSLAEITNKNASNNPLEYNINLNASGSIGLFAQADKQSATTAARIENIKGNIFVGNGSNANTESAGVKVESQGSGYISYDDANGQIRLTSGLDSGQFPNISAAILGILKDNASGDMNIKVTDINNIDVNVTRNASGIASYADVNVSGNIDIKFLKGQITARGQDVNGILAYHRGNGLVLIRNAGNVSGGSIGTDNYGSGIHMLTTDSAYLFLENSGSIGAVSDRAIYSSNTSGISRFDNRAGGEITGYFTITGNNVSFNSYANSVIKLQNFSSGSKATVNNQFGGHAVFNLNGLISFSDASYNGSINKAELNGIATFNHNTTGVIDTTGAGIIGGSQAGDIIKISNSGTSNYYSGGIWKMNVLLDNNANSNGGKGTSDILQLENVILGIAPTTIFVYPVSGSVGSATTGDGILVVEANASDINAFTLGNNVAWGAYEYVLQRAANQNWYLQSRLFSKPYNPTTGAYLGNMTASEIFAHSLYDRQGFANGVQGVDSEPGAAWVGLKYAKTKGKTADQSMESKNSAMALIIGKTIASKALQKGDLYIGLLGGFGRNNTDANPYYTSDKAKGKSNGYNFGLYGTWFEEKTSGRGWYIDSWAQFAFYNNEVTSTSQPDVKEKYDSHGMMISAETGYGFLLGTESQGWLLTPQVQLIYSYLNTDQHDGQNGVQAQGGSNNIGSARLGLRLYPAAGENSHYQPFVETNWINHFADRKMKFDQAGTGVIELTDNSRAKNIKKQKKTINQKNPKNIK